MVRTNSNVESLRPFNKDQVRAMRDNFGWTRAQFANAVGVSTATVEAWEFGRREVSLDISQMSSRSAIDCISDNHHKDVMGKYTIKEARRFLGKKVEDFASSLGLSVSAIRSYEKGVRRPTPKTVARIEDSIRIRLGELGHKD